MAIVKNDPFPGTDYSKYLEWEKVVTPSGQVFYVVPGNPAYVYDPVASNATGRKVFRANPKASIKEQEEAKKNEEKARKQQEFNMSPTGQLLPVAAGTGGLIAAHHFMKPEASALEKMAEAKMAKDLGLQTSTTATSQGATAAQGATVPATMPGQVAATPVGTAANGGTMMSDGSIQTDVLPPGTEISDDGTIFNAENGAIVGRVVQGALGAYQIYQGINEFKKDKIGGALSVASGGVNVAGALGYKSAAPFAGPLMAASGLYHGINAFGHGGEGIRSSGTELGAGVGLMLGGPIGMGVGAVAGNVLGYGIDKLGGLGLYHETTRQRAQKHTGELAAVAPEDAAYQGYVQAMRDQYNAPPPDPSKPYHGGQYSSWDEYKKAGLDPNDLTGVYGNIKAFGPEWASLSEAQRVAVTKGIIDADLYTSNKGEVEITDETKAKEIKDNVLKGFGIGAQAQAQAHATPPQTQGQAAAQGASAPGEIILQQGPPVDASKATPMPRGGSLGAQVAATPIKRPVIRDGKTVWVYR